MGQLSRHSKKLLTTVSGRPHASSDDHYADDANATAAVDTSLQSFPRHISQTKPIAHAMSKRPTGDVIEIEHGPRQKAKKQEQRRKAEAEASLPSPNQTASSRSSFGTAAIMIEDEEDVNGSPKSSDEDDNDYKETVSFPTRATASKRPAFKTISMRPIAKSVNSSARRPDKAFISSTSKLRSPKRKANELDDDELDDSSDEIFPNARPLPPYKGFKHTRPVKKHEQNIFVPPQKKFKALYGKDAEAKRKRDELAAAKEAKIVAEAAEKQKVAKRKIFRIAVLPDIAGGDSFQSTKAFNSSFASTGAEQEELGADTSPLSELSDDEVEELDMSEGVLTMKCSFCGDRVKTSLLENFEIEYLKGRSLTYKWQRRFCTWHKRQTAQATWRKRGYPQIDWTNLAQKMRRHETLLIRVINDRVESHYRQRLRDKCKQGLEDLKGDITDQGHGRGGSSMGYYGPRGEKLITEHIVARLSDTIRRRSTKDKLISAASIQGGVAGFVQIVLAPHMAELLIKEDMDLEGDDWETKARDIIAESSEVGDLLNPEEDGIDDGAHETGLTKILQNDEDDGELEVMTIGGCFDDL